MSKARCVKGEAFLVAGQALTAVALLCGGDYDEGGGAGKVGARQSFTIVRTLLADARRVSWEEDPQKTQRCQPGQRSLTQSSAKMKHGAICVQPLTARGCASDCIFWKFHHHHGSSAVYTHGASVSVPITTLSRQDGKTAMCWRCCQRSCRNSLQELSDLTTSGKQLHSAIPTWSGP